MDQENKMKSIEIEDELKKSYLDYSMSMITSRALPDVRDGLKPVHRRVLFGMHELGLLHSRQTRKCARVVGDVIGKYHPHGDSAVYEALVRLGQDFSMRYRMVEGQGNFGSIDGDPPAAMRYTECRMTLLAEEMLIDIDKETVDFIPNYDDSYQEPTVLPAKIPYLLINGSTGIAVGMATNIAPHNLTEVINAIVATMNNPQIELPELMEIIPGPDFPTGGVIYGKAGIQSAMATGRGKVLVRGRAEVEKLPGDKEQIVITEIPYMVNKTMLLEKIADLVRNKIIDGITLLRDESDRHGMRIVIGLRKGSFPEIILNQLFKLTPLQSTFGINSLALVNRRPKLLGLKDFIENFIQHQIDVVTRRTIFDLKKAQARAHILEGLKIALNNIDAIVDLIKKSESPSDAQTKLQETFALSEEQAKAILEMRLQRLTGLEQGKIEGEYQELLQLIKELSLILESETRRKEVIIAQLVEIREKFGDKRRTEIVEAEGEVDLEDMIADEDMVITMSNSGYIKRCKADTYRSQGRGGRGVKGMGSKEDDFIHTLIIASAHNYLLFFTNVGRCYWLKVYRIPEVDRRGKGRPIINLLQLKPDEHIAAIVPVKEFSEQTFILAATKRGVINKQPLTLYSNVRRDGINAFSLDEGDQVIGCKLTNGNNHIILGTRNGQAVHFHESATRDLGRNTRGMRGITLKGEDTVVSMIVVNENDTVLTVTERGYGKRTPVSEYRVTNRGGSGIINIKCSDRNGPVVGLVAVDEANDIILITKNGIIMRSSVTNISSIGRNTQGVKLINVDEGDSVIDIAIIEKDDDPAQTTETPVASDQNHPPEGVDD